MEGEKQKKLRERAEILSQEKPALESRGKTISVLSFYLADEMYGVEAEYVERVLALKRFTDLPCTPDYILGIINVKGNIVAVIDIKKLFNVAGKELTDQSQVIILEDKGINFGILIDEIIGLEEVELSELQEKPAEIAGIKSELIRGVTDKRLIIINTGELFQDPRIVINEEI